MKQPQYINVFDNGKDTLISKNPVSGQYFVITPYETLHCCKGIAAIYMRHAAPPDPKPLPQRVATAAEAVLGRGSAGANTDVESSIILNAIVGVVLFFITMFATYLCMRIMW